MKETIIELTTGVSGKETIVRETRKIRKRLYSVIVEASKPVSIRIFLEEFPNIMLYETKLFIGQKYLPLRKEAVFPDGGISEVPEWWYLNDNVVFEVSNNTNAKVKFVVRAE